MFFSGVRGQDQHGAGGSPECHRLAGSKALLGHANGDTNVVIDVRRKKTFILLDDLYTTDSCKRPCLYLAT